MHVKNICIHVVYNCSVCSGVKSYLNIDNPKLQTKAWRVLLCSGDCLNNSHGGCEFLSSALLFTLRNLSVRQIFCSCLVEKGSVIFSLVGVKIGCAIFWTLSVLQWNQSSSDVATYSAAAEGTEFVPLYTYCQYEHINVVCFTLTEDFIQGINQKVSN